MESQPDNAVETPYKVGLKGINLDSENKWGELGLAILNSNRCFMDLNLEGCTSTAIPDGYSEREVIGTQIKSHTMEYLLA